MKLLDIIYLLPRADWLGLAWFFFAWFGYAAFARYRSKTEDSLLAITNHYRCLWAMQTTYRDNRVIDGVMLQNLNTSLSFFASTTILIIGGLLAVLGTSEKVTELARELQFAAQTPQLVFDLKLLLLTGIFVYAFFRFSWSIRQYSFGALMLASMPEPQVFERGDAQRETYATPAGHVLGLAAQTFNDGLRAYYFSFAAVLWFFTPLAMSIGTAVVITVLYLREFRSDVLSVMRRLPKRPTL